MSEKEKPFSSYSFHNGFDPGWGTKARRALFRAACKYLKMNPDKVENAFMVGIHSVLHSSAICLDGSLLEKVKNDSAFVSKENELIQRIKKDVDYKIRSFSSKDKEARPFFGTQLGGSRAKTEMWKQALEFWKWHNEYSATWEVAFDELTWTVRTVLIRYEYKVDIQGNIRIDYWFTDTLDLRPGGRSKEYDAVCSVLGFLYHDLMGNSDELQVQGYWSKNISG